LLDRDCPYPLILLILQVKVERFDLVSQKLKSRFKQTCKCWIFTQHFHFQEISVAARNCDWLFFKQYFPKTSLVILGELLWEKQVEQMFVLEFKEQFYFLNLRSDRREACP